MGEIGRRVGRSRVHVAWGAILLAGVSPGCRRADDAQAAVPPAVSAPAAAAAGVSAMGRLEPKNGLLRVAGPAVPVAVVGTLLVDKGDRVRAGQLLAVLEGESVRAAAVARAQAELTKAEAWLGRNSKLHESDVVSDATQDDMARAVDVARAQLREAEAELARLRVLSPIDGEVIDVYARSGERVGPEGLVELGRTHEMYAVAEVYESDVRRVRVGQRALVTSPGLDGPLSGTVDRIGRKIGKLDEIGADPAARADARVVEVEVRLDDGSTAAGLTNLQVEVVIQP